MARYMAEEEKLYRAVIEYIYPNGMRVPTYRGPFTATAPATSVINREKASLAYQQNHGWGWAGEFYLSTHIEVCDPTWGKVTE